MFNKGETDIKRLEETPARPRSLAVAENGIQTGADFANLMSAMMSDVISGSLAPDVANAACNAGGKLLKVVEMQYKYVPPRTTGDGVPVLTLAPGNPTER
jgi:hypothetical protein